MITKKEMILEFINSKDFIAKIACLVLAVILWSYIGNRNDNELRYKIKAEVINLSEDHIITDMEQRYVGVRVRGETEDLQNIDKNDMSVSVDLSDAVVGKPYRYPLSLEYSDMPESVDISLEKSKIFVTVDKKMSKSVFVRPQVNGKVAAGYFKGNIHVEPERVMLYGSSDMIQNVSHVDTETVSVNGISSTHITEVALRTDELNISSISSDTVTVKVQVFRDENIYTYNPELDIYGMMEKYSYHIDTSSFTVYIQSQSGEKPRIDTHDVKIWIDLDPVYKTDFITESGIKLAEIQRKVPVKAMINKNAGNLDIITIVPDSVLVKIQR